jgi:ribonuclease Y
MNYVFPIFAMIAGIFVGYMVRVLYARFQKKSLEMNVQEILLKARTDAQKIITDAELRSEKTLAQSRDLETTREKDFMKTKEHLERREQTLDNRQGDLDRDYENLKHKIDEVRGIKEKVEDTLRLRTNMLESIAQMNTSEAQELLIKEVETSISADLQSRMQKLELFAEERLKERAKVILTTAINRLASSTASEHTTTSVKIESDEIKGQIIGKEGRNIRTFERMAGVELLIDDSPNEIIISSFDPIRRQVARVALENLIKDGRIQPAKIEEFIEKAQDRNQRNSKEKRRRSIIRMWNIQR